jgi:hypothetical protein
MPISFANQEEDPPAVETVDDLFESEDEDKDRDLAALPDRMLFGEEECGAIFALSSDKGTFLRVCGCSLATCKREGHKAARITDRAKPGSYKTIRSRKFVDGELETWVPAEE